MPKPKNPPKRKPPKLINKNTRKLLKQVDGMGPRPPKKKK